MITSPPVPFDSVDELQSELESLRQSVLSLFLPTILVGAWLWFSFAVIKGWALGTNALVTLLLMLACVAVFKLRRSHYRLACWVLLVAIAAAVNLALSAFPGTLAPAFGVLVIVTANALLGTPEALVFALLTWLPQAFGPRLGLPLALPADWGVQAFLLYLLTAGVAWLAGRPLRTSVSWALAGWNNAYTALHEARDRRGEMYRVVRALEEATYRLEHTNNELVVAQREAEVARAIRGRLAATVSHELRAPLNLILGFSRLMALSPESYGVSLPQPYRADVDTIYRNSQHLVALVDDILDLSQIEAQRLPLVKDQIDLEEDVIKKAVSVVQALAERKGLTLRQEIARPLPWLLADQVRLRQALLNLLVNAVRFTEHGSITVRAARHEADLLVSVEDTGRGIAPEDMPRLFQEFSQVHLTDTREAGGSGLGLSISKHLIELHGGQIWAESKKGSGTTFYFTIPLPESEAIVGQTMRTGDVSLSSLPSGHCLVVHDDPATVRLLARYIEGFRIIGLPDSTQLLSMTAELHPRAIVTTLEQSQEVAAQLARTAYEVPLITCALPHMAQGEFQGIVSYLVKPIAPEALAAVMRKLEKPETTTILIVDDDPDAVSLLERLLLLIPRPYRLLKAYTGAQALATMAQTLPDVVLLDYIMPGMDGTQVVARMRAAERTRHVPVVIISAQGWIEDNANLGTEISLHMRAPISLAAGAQCLQSLLNSFGAYYLEREGVAGSSAAEWPDPTACPANPPLPAPAPDGSD